MTMTMMMKKCLIKSALHIGKAGTAAAGRRSELNFCKNCSTFFSKTVPAKDLRKSDSLFEEA